MLSWTRNSASMSDTGWPQCPRGFARVALVLAWVVFWLNTALFPCCEAIAATFAGHATEISQSDSAPEPAHAAGGTHSEPPTHNPTSPCDYSLTAGPANVGVDAALAVDHFSPALATVTAADLGPPAANHSANLAPRSTPPPLLRIYLRTSRLRI